MYMLKIGPYTNDADYLHVSVIKQPKNLPILSDDKNPNRVNVNSIFGYS